MKLEVLVEKRPQNKGVNTKCDFCSNIADCLSLKVSVTQVAASEDDTSHNEELATQEINICAGCGGFLDLLGPVEKEEVEEEEVEVAISIKRL